MRIPCCIVRIGNQVRVLSSPAAVLTEQFPCFDIKTATEHRVFGKAGDLC